MPCTLCRDPARCDRAGLCQEFKAAAPPLRKQEMTNEEHKLEPVAHMHSNGDFCADRQITSKDWPVNLYTEEQVNELRAHLQQRPLTGREVTDADAIQRSEPVRDALLAYHERPCDLEAIEVVLAVLLAAAPSPDKEEATGAAGVGEVGRG